MFDRLSRILHLIFTSCMISIDFCHICAEYHWITRSSRLHVALSANICMRKSVGFFTYDEFCRICHNCDELGLIVHICDVFDRIPHVWYSQWDILHVIFSANIGVRNSVGIFTCDVFCRIYHDCDEFGGNFSQLWKIRWNYSRVLYLVRCQTGDTLSVNIGVRNSVAFFTCDVFCPISHNLYELSRFFHSRVVYHWISHVWHNRSNILHETLSVNIGVRNSVGFFTCDVFCWIWDNFVEFGQTLHICEVFDRILHVWPIKSDILHLIFSANIGVRNSVGFFTCDEFLSSMSHLVWLRSIFATYVQYISELLMFGIIGRVDYTWQYLCTAVKNPMELLTCAIFGQMSNRRHTFGE